MTKQAAKQFARIYVGQMLFTHEFDKDTLDCPDEDKDMIKLAINDLFFKLIGNCHYMDNQDIYDVVNQENL